MGSKLDSHQTLHVQSQYRERAHIRAFVVAYRAGLRDPVFRSLTFEEAGGAWKLSVQFLIVCSAKRSVLVRCCCARKFTRYTLGMSSAATSSSNQ